MVKEDRAPRGPKDTALTNSLVLHIHDRIFGALYEWAGRWRTVNISKPGITWPPAMFVPQNLVVHPFREGNARTIKLLTDLLAAQTGRPLLTYDQSDQGRERYIHAASMAFRKDYRPMVEVIRQALAAGRRKAL